MRYVQGYATSWIEIAIIVAHKEEPNEYVQMVESKSEDKALKAVESNKEMFTTNTGTNSVGNNDLSARSTNG